MKRYNFSSAEKKWNAIWKTKRVYEPDLSSTKKPFYNLMMFPYPSAEGLHVGNMYAFTGSDIYGRFKRMQGYDVFEPMGLDGFGIHSENYAIKIGTHPVKQAKISERRFYKQLEIVGNGFAWNERLETYDPEYYKWTQWIFVQMWKHGLAYRKKQPVNWCPSCKTVLADEQVIDGKCERCGTIVVKKELEQWFFKITKYAERLLQNLETIDWSEKVKIAQRNWIGKSEGALIKFKIINDKFQINSKAQNSKHEVEVFTTRPDTLFGATYMVLAPEHPLLENKELGIRNYDDVAKYVASAKKKSEEERIENKEKTGVELKGVKAINPANNEEIPIFVADYVLSGYGTGAIMAVPGHDLRDSDFARKLDLPVRRVIAPRESNFQFPISNFQINPNDQNPKETELYEGDGILINSGKFDGIDSEKAKWEITKFVEGKKTTQYRLRDWLVSRQRYWGPPIPMVYCESCAKAGRSDAPSFAKATEGTAGWYAVPEKNLPVKLPFVKDFRPKGKDESPLASAKSFFEARCPGCRGKARRETDVSDTFLDSAWYYLRYIDPKNKKEPFAASRIKRWLPVNMYIGGAEHSVLHLLYVRFVALALRDMKLLNFPSKTGEPFPLFRAHGLLIKDGAKMSKSKGNVINPDEYIKEFGADAFRTYLMFLAPFEQGGDFRDQGILGITRFLDRIWKFQEGLKGKFAKKESPSIEQFLHYTVKKVTEDIESLHYNTAISALMILFNKFEEAGSVTKGQYKTFVCLIAPFAPYLSEELWGRIGEKKSIHRSPWPRYNPRLVVAETFPLVVQINGKHRATVEAERGLSEEKARTLALSHPMVHKAVEGKTPKRVIYVKDRLINFVI